MTMTLPIAMKKRASSTISCCQFATSLFRPMILRFAKCLVMSVDVSMKSIGISTGYASQKQLLARPHRHLPTILLRNLQLVEGLRRTNLTKLCLALIRAWQDPVTPRFNVVASFCPTELTATDADFMPIAPPFLSSASLPNLVPNRKC